MSDALLDNIRRIRAANNIKWMDILAIALKHAPDETKEILQDINENDHAISACLGEIIRSDRP